MYHVKRIAADTEHGYKGLKKVFSVTCKSDDSDICTQSGIDYYLFFFNGTGHCLAG